jgi:arylsulfatase A-like enzyme/Tfp pilus assembly protein PilF
MGKRSARRPRGPDVTAPTRTPPGSGKALGWLGGVLMGLAVVLLGAAAWWWAPSRQETPGLNLLVITLDTTRADRLGAYGFADAGTPVLDRLAHEGTLFLHATSAAPLTLPSHSSIFTGRFPPVHGVRDNGGFFLDEKEETLAETLKAAGFNTAAFIGAYVLDSKWGINQGFSKYVDDFDLSKYRAISLGAIQRPGNEVVDRALEWMQGLDTSGRSRFFAWVHLYDPHTPYEAPEPYKSAFANRPYQAEIAFTDAQVGRLISFLESRHLLDRTVVMIAGDHGESLGDHGEQAHGFFVYESVTHVPLMVRAPMAETKRRRVEDPVRLVDITPTALELMGVKSSVPMDGRSLVPLLTGATRELGLESYSEAMYPLHHFGWSDLRALREGRFKLIAAPRPELYDLAADPGETTNLFESRRSLGERMLGRLDDMEAEWQRSGAGRRQEPVEVDPDAKARLAALGYVGSFVATAVDKGKRAQLADPKDKVHLFNMISHARDLTKQEDAFDEVVGTLKKVLDEDPKVIDAWFMLGNVHAARGKPEQAIGFFKRALELKPDDEMAVINMANAYRNLGRDEEALVGYQRFLQLDPRNAQVRYEAAQILIDRGQFDEAAKHLQQTLELEPKLAAARNALGVIAIRRGDLAGAEREIKAAIDQKPDVRLAHFNLALIAEQRGQAQVAIDEYQREIATHPNAFKAAFNLGKLYEQMGNRQAQESAFKQAIEMNPGFAEGHFYLAKLYLDENRELDQAITLARRGLELNPRSEFAPLGHYVLADIYSRRGLIAESQREAERGRQSERAARERARKSVLD